MSLEDFTLVRLGALANGNYKVSFKEEKRKKKIFLDLEIVGFHFFLKIG